MSSFDYIIIGSGIAGLYAAHTLKEHGRVAIISKGPIEESASRYAQGGIAAAISKQDSPIKHLEDTIKAGGGFCDPEAAKELVTKGPQHIYSLIDAGVNFDRSHDSIELTKEAAHSEPRILHVKDYTGKAITQTLIDQVMTHKNIHIFPETFVTELIKEHDQVIGCYLLKDQKITTLYAKATLLATGGCGQVYSHTTNPPLASGDGYALAKKAGATIRDMEFIQFHPTVLTVGGNAIFLITEAIRGEGAVLRNIHGHRFMPDYHEAAELAPRDIVSRAIYSEIQKTKNHCFLDLSPLQGDIKSRFPTIYKKCYQSGFDITRDFIPISPAAHYCMGGVQTEMSGQTSVKGLYAAGEVASLRIHGANRLASNSLLEGLVFGFNAAQAMIVEKPKQSSKSYKHPVYLPSTSEILSNFKTAKQAIRSIMWRKVSIVRKSEELKQALAELKTYSWLTETSYCDSSCFEIQNLYEVALSITQASIARKESIGAHFISQAQA